MGLLDLFNNMDGRTAMGLLAAAGPTPQPMSFGQRVYGLLNQIDAQKKAEEDRQLNAKLIQAKIDEFNAQAEQRKAAVVAAQQKAAQELKLQQEQSAFLSNPRLPAGAGHPSFMAESGGRTPEENARMMAEANRPGALNMAEAIRLYGPEKAIKLREGMFGKVDKTLDVTGPGGQPMNRVLSQWGEQIGQDTPKPVKLSFQDTGGQIVPLNEYTGQPGATPIDKGGGINDLVIRGPDGKPMINPVALRAKTAVAAAGAARNLVDVQNYKPASVELQTQQMKGLNDNYQALKFVPATINNMERAKALVQRAGGFVGFGAENKLEIAKFFNNNLGTSIDPTGVRSAEELRTRLFENVKDNLKKMDAQPSQLQQKMMMDAFGKLGTDPEALPRIMDAIASVLRDKVEIHNIEAKAAESKGIVSAYPMTIDLPQIPSSPVTDQADEILRRSGFGGK